MKKLKMLLCFVPLLLLSMPVFAADSNPDFSQYFETFGAFILIVPVVFELVKRLLGNAPAIIIQISSWIIGIVLAFIAWVLNLGFFAEIVEWWKILLLGLGASLAANGVFDTGLITWILDAIGIKTSKK